jgi:hypothetical protein
MGAVLALAVTGLASAVGIASGRPLDTPPSSTTTDTVTTTTASTTAHGRPPIPTGTGYKLIVGYGPVCNPTTHKDCGMRPVVGAVAKLYDGATLVVRATTNAKGQALLRTPKANHRYTIVVAGKAAGRSFVKRDRMAATMPGVLIPYELSVCVSAFC